VVKELCMMEIMELAIAADARRVCSVIPDDTRHFSNQT
jgi:hypothetical protein